MACQKQVVYAPVGYSNQEKENLDASIKINKNRNQQEREFIQNWLKQHPQKRFFNTKMNYWASIDFNLRGKNEEKPLSYEYFLYDMNETLIYQNPTMVEHKYPAEIHELVAVEDALQYMKKNEEVVLLVPSALAYGKNGDGDKIPNDLPLIIRLKLK